MTALISAANSGDQEAFDRLFAILYGDLHRIAHARLWRSETLTLIDTTALVHESYLRFVKAGRVELSDKAHFLAYAARVMRSIIVDAVRQHRADRHGGNAVHVTLNTSVGESVGESEDEIIRVHEAIGDLAKVDPRLASVVEMRYFGGLSESEIAGALGLTDRTVRRDWEKARLLLAAALR